MQKQVLDYQKAVEALRQSPRGAGHKRLAPHTELVGYMNLRKADGTVTDSYAPWTWRLPEPPDFIELHYYDTTLFTWYPTEYKLGSISDKNLTPTTLERVSNYTPFSMYSYGSWVLVGNELSGRQHTSGYEREMFFTLQGLEVLKRTDKEGETIRTISYKNDFEASELLRKLTFIASEHIKALVYGKLEWGWDPGPHPSLKHKVWRPHPQTKSDIIENALTYTELRYDLVWSALKLSGLFDGNKERDPDYQRVIDTCHPSMFKARWGTPRTAKEKMDRWTAELGGQDKYYFPRVLPDPRQPLKHPKQLYGNLKNFMEIGLRRAAGITRQRV